jgi:hypothetical protein
MAHQKITRTEDPYNGFFADFIGHTKPYTALLKVHNILCGIALRENDFLSSKLANLSSQTGRIEK